MEGLKKVFKVIDYRPTDNEMEMISKNLFKTSNEVSFESFLKIYSLNLDSSMTIDIKNSFNLLGYLISHQKWNFG